MRLTAVFTAIIILLAADVLTAAVNKTDTGIQAKLCFDLQEKTDFQVTSRGGQGLMVEISLPSAVQALNDAAVPLIAESPSLPMVSKWVVIPEGVRAAARVDCREAVVYRADKFDVWAETDAAATSLLSSSEDNVPVKLGRPANFRGVRMIPVMVQPLQAGGDGASLVENRRVTVNLDFTAEPLAASSSAPKPFSRQLSRMLDEITANPPHRDFAFNYLSRMLIVYNEDLAGQDVMGDINAWAGWKRRLGYDVALHGVDVSGDQDDIKDELRAYYEDIQHGSLEFLVIMGADTPYVNINSPYYFPHYGWVVREGERDIQIFGDLYWVTFEGDDYVPEVVFSRFPCANAQDLSYALSRSRRYEQNPQGGDWLRRCVQTIDLVILPLKDALADLDITYWSQRRLREMGYTAIDTIWGEDRPFIGEPIQDSFDEGASLGLGCGWNYGVVNYVGATKEIDDMSEVGRMHPFLISNVEHYTQPIFADFFNAGDDNNENGLLAGFGFIEPVDGNHLVGHLVGWSVWGMRYLQVYTGGYLFQFGLMQFIPVEEYYVSGENDWEEMGQLHYYGDPTIMIRNREPVALASDLPNSVNAGATLLQFTLTAGEEPAADATVSVMQEGGFHYVTHSNADGSVAFTLPEGVDPDEALLVTASLHNTLPLIVDVGVSQPRVNIALEEGGFEDENDGLFMNGETVDLSLTFANRGNSNAQNLTASFSSDSEYLTFSRENAAVQNINAGANGTLSQAVEMTLSPACPGGTLIQVRIDVTSGNDHWQHAFDLISSGPGLIPSNIQPRNIAPRSQGGLAITLTNVGDGASDSLTAILTTSTRGVEIINGERGYPVIPAGEARAADGEFILACSDHFIPGNQLDLSLVLTSQRGYEQTIPISFGPVGEPASDDPLGPDGYGYNCFDSEDNRDNWSLAPNYRWMEVNPFVVGEEDHYQGQLVQFPFAIVDSSIDLSNWDDCQRIPLPFTFTYYGQEYDTVVVSTNGWISMGSEIMTYRSDLPWPIPGIGGHDAQIAAYIADLKVYTDIFDRTVGVFTYYKTDEDLFVIEWSQIGVVNELESMLNFEVVLYDPEIYSTPTGDGEIAIQYKAAEILRGPDLEYPYPLIGIRGPDGNDGIMYSWRNNEYAEHLQLGNPPVQAVEIHDEFALLFTTAVQMEQGSAHGRIVNADDDQPIANAAIDPIRASEVITLNDGSFRFDNLRAGHYHALVTAHGFSDYGFNFEILEGQDIELPLIRLLHPTPRLRSDLLEYSLRPDTTSRVQVWACLENTGTGSLNYSAEVRYEDGSAPNFNIIQQLHMDRIAVNGAANSRIRGYAPTFALELNSYFIPVIHRGSRTRYISVVSKEGQQTGVIPQPIPANNDAVLQALAWDGQALWGGYMTTDSLNPIMMVRFSTEGESLFAFQTPFANISSLPVVYSPQRNSLFITEWNEDFYEFDLDGNLIQRFDFSIPGHIPEISGFGWNPYDFDGMPLYAVDQWQSGDELRSMSIFKINPATGDNRLLQQVDFNHDILPGAACGVSVVLDYSADRNAIVTVQQYGPRGTPSDSLVVRELGLDLNFMVPNSFHAMSGIVPAGGFQWLGFEAAGAGRAHGSEARWSYYVTHNGAEAPLLARMVLRFDSTSGINAGGEALPLEFGLQSIYPNPFNGVTRINYVVSERILTRIAAYDLQGRLAQELYKGVPEVGEHYLCWAGGDLPSGVYIIRMECASASHSRKVLLIK